MSDLKPQSRFRLASKESHQPTFPVAGPIPNHVFLGPLEGGIAIELQSVQALAFEESIALGELSRLSLSTTGYDDPELVEMAEAEASAFQIPPIAKQPQKVSLTAIAPAKAKSVPGFDAVPVPDLPVTAPRLDARTVHTRFAFGPNPNKPKPAPAPVAPPPAPAPAVAVKPPVQQPPVQQPPKPAPVVNKPAPPPPPKVVKPASPPPPPPPAPKPATPSITVKATPPPPPPAFVQPPAAAAAVATPAPAAKAPEPSKMPEPAVVERPVEKPVEKPAAAAAAVAAPAPEREEKAPERPKINVRPAAPSQRPQVRTGNAVPAERPEPVVATPPPPAKPKVQPIRPETPAAPPSIAAEAPVKTSAAVADSEIPHLGMPTGTEGGSGKRLGIIAAAVVVVAGGGYFLFMGGDSKKAQSGANNSSNGPALTISDQTPPNMILGGGGWATNWGTVESINKGKNISLFRPTMSMPDYRIEFRGQVESKALGWIFRAKDPRNFYVMKIEMIKRGLNPVFALVKYAVLNGKENTHTQIMLEGDYRQDNVWRVRQDVRGNKFTTYVQDKLADYWTDDEIKTGGAGFYNDKGEFGQIKSSTFSYLPAVGK